MSDREFDRSPEAVDAALGEMKLVEEGSVTETRLERTPSPIDDNRPPPPQISTTSRSTTPEMMKATSQTPRSGDEVNEEVVDGEIMVVQEPGKAPKLSRKSSQKVITRPPPLFDHLEDATPDATTQFQVIRDCIYGSKYMGSADHDALGCDCAEEWRKFNLDSLAT